jgi:hypothetical protein
MTVVTSSSNPRMNQYLASTNQQIINLKSIHKTLRRISKRGMIDRGIDRSQGIEDTILSLEIENRIRGFRGISRLISSLIQTNLKRKVLKVVSIQKNL